MPWSELLPLARKLTPMVPFQAPREIRFMTDPCSSRTPWRCPPPDGLISPEQRAALLSNGRRTYAGEDLDPRPVVKLHLPDAAVVFLLTELDPAEPDRVFGLVDLGLGFPELDHASLAEIASIRGPLGLAVVADPTFAANRSLSSYATLARHRCRVEV